MKINFYLDSNLSGSPESIKEYEEIWETEGEEITNSIEKHSQLKFKETYINAIISKSKPQSNPLTLRTEDTYEEKLGTLVHELCHRIISGNYNKENRLSWKHKSKPEVEIHKVIFLFLYDTLVDLYGDQFARRRVETESNYKYTGEDYKKAWDWALSKNTYEERQGVLKEIYQSKIVLE